MEQLYKVKAVIAETGKKRTVIANLDKIFNHFQDLKSIYTGELLDIIKLKNGNSQKI